MQAGGIITTVTDGSIAAELGWQPGDRVLSINGHPLRDVIDYRFYGAEESLQVVIERDGQRMAFDVERDYGQELGVDFAEQLFDGLRLCDNRCPFCFLAQMPKGLRRSLYLRDDDYRLSFLTGSFVTLTNLTEADWARLAEQRLSPLYVSVHAADPALRRRLLGNPNAPDVLAQLRRLGDLNISVHTQVVLVPGLNDGPALARTVADLAALYPTVQSIALAPVGLTRYHRAGFRTHRPDEAGPLLDWVAARQREFRPRHGRHLVYAADEWYLLAGRQAPPADAYDGFPQLENGVGLVRTFLDDWNANCKLQVTNSPSALCNLQSANLQSAICNSIVVCGTLIAALMRRVAGELAASTGAALEVAPVANRFFGPTVTVSGLLTGGDVVDALRERDLGHAVFLPRAMFDAARVATLDDMTVGDLEWALGVRVVVGSGMGDVAAGLAAQGEGDVAQRGKIGYNGGT